MSSIEALGKIYFSMDQTKLHTTNVLNGIDGLAKYRCDIHNIQTMHNGFLYVDVNLDDIAHLCMTYDNAESKKKIKAIYETIPCCVCGSTHQHSLGKLLEVSDNWHFLTQCRNYNEIKHNNKVISCNNRLCTFIHESNKFVADIEGNKYNKISEVDTCYRVDKKSITGDKTTTNNISTTLIIPVTGRVVDNSKWSAIVNNKRDAPIIQVEPELVIKTTDHTTAEVKITDKPAENNKLKGKPKVNKKTVIINQSQSDDNINNCIIEKLDIKDDKPTDVKDDKATGVKLVDSISIDTKRAIIDPITVSITGNQDIDSSIVVFCDKYNISTIDTNLIYTIYTRCKLFKGIFEVINNSAIVNKMEFNMLLTCLGFDLKHKNTAFIKALVFTDEKNKLIKEIDDMLALINTLEN